MSATVRDPDATRRRILEAAFEEIHRNGYQAASLDRILADTGLTKGALYHHFPNKAAVAHALVDEVIRDEMIAMWIAPVEKATDPIDGLLEVIDPADEYIVMACENGCPVNNLAQEMANRDEELRRRINGLMEEWRRRLADALLRGQGAGHVRREVDCHATATFIVASIEGCLGTAKASKDPSLLRSCLAGLTGYLSSLRTAS